MTWASSNSPTPSSKPRASGSIDRRSRHDVRGRQNSADLAEDSVVDSDSVSYAVSGPLAPVEILIDRWGVPHVYASSPYDAFFAQGFNAARDRLWQIDLWRRRGLGLLSEVFG